MIAKCENNKKLEINFLVFYKLAATYEMKATQNINIQAFIVNCWISVQNHFKIWLNINQIIQAITINMPAIILIIKSIIFIKIMK